MSITFELYDYLPEKFDSESRYKYWGFATRAAIIWRLMATHHLAVRMNIDILSYGQAFIVTELKRTPVVHLDSN